MKKLCLLIIAIMLSSFINVSAANKFEGKDNMNIVYIGGSITLGSGAEEGYAWRDLVGKWFADTYDGTKVKNHNAGIHGTGTGLGYYRTRKDVIEKNPDIVFIEFAVNDASAQEEVGNKALEGIVNGLQESETNPYIIFIYTTDENYDDVSEYQEKLAKYYGIPSIDLQKGVIEPHVANGGAIRDLLSDGVHPNKTGYQKYAEYIISCLETGNYFKKPLVKDVSYVESQLGIEPFDFTMPRFVSASDSLVTATGNWEKKENYYYGEYLSTSEPGATLEYKFSGPMLGMMNMISRTGGKVNIEIDGKVVKTYDTYYDVSEGTVLGYDNKELLDNEHTLKITVLDNPTNASEPFLVDIYGLFVSDGESDIIDKLTVHNIKIMKLAEDLEGNESVEDIEALEKGNLNVVEADVKNITNTAIDAMCMLAVYDSEGKLVGVNQVKKTFLPDSKETFGIGAIVPDQENAGCKLFMWDNNFSPIYKSTILN